MTTKQQYWVTHNIAKLITCFLVVMLTIVNRHLDIIYIDILAVVIWFFGVNPVAYMIEAVLKWRHLHEKV